MAGEASQWPQWIAAGLLLIAAAARAAAQQPPPPDIQITLSSSAESWRPSLTEAAQSAAAIGREWLGPHSGRTIEIAIAPPLWQGPGAMTAERRVATAVIRSWWPPQLSDQHADRVLDGFAAYLQGHVIEQLFDRRHLRRAYRSESIDYFGGHVVWSLPPLRRSRTVDPDDRYAAAFTTLERWMGEPLLQSAMAVVAQLPPDRLTGNAIIGAIGSAAGQDVSWVFAFASGEETIDYAVADLTSAAGECASPCFETSVTVARLGPVPVTGSSRPRIAGFDAGDALTLRVAFEDGARAEATWDGRDESRTFRFQGPAPAVAAHLDPDRVVAFDRNALNNSIVRPTPTNVPVRKWMARWIVWLQNTILTYGFFS